MYDLRPVAEKIQKADAILIGASNGLSMTEGLHLFADNQAFENLFGDFKDKYGLQCLLHGMGTRWPSEEVKWAFWSRLIHHYCGQYQPTQVMQDLKAIVGNRDYFVLTSNGECHFERSGFAPEKIYEIEGTWLTMQCARPCHDTLYPILELAEQMAAAEQDGRIPSDLVPRCPRCGGPMEVHMAAGPNMVPDHGATQRFQSFLNQYHEKKLVVLELGIGWRNQLIKAPLMRLVDQEPNATYVTINLGEVYIADSIKRKSFGLDGGRDFIRPSGGGSTMNISGKETLNMKLGIIRCTQTEDYCPGSGDFQTIRERKGAFAGVEDIELVGFINCGGCPGKKVVLRANSLVSQGADTIAFASCIQKGTPIGYPCPFAKRMKDLVQNAVGDKVQILDYTHDAGPKQE